MTRRAVATAGVRTDFGRVDRPPGGDERSLYCGEDLVGGGFELVLFLTHRAGVVDDEEKVDDGQFGDAKNVAGFLYDAVFILGELITDFGERATVGEVVDGSVDLVVFDVSEGGDGTDQDDSIWTTPYSVDGGLEGGR